jgi:hypothetical protein
MPDATVEKKVWSYRDQIINLLAPKILSAKISFMMKYGLPGIIRHPANCLQHLSAISQQPASSI